MRTFLSFLAPIFLGDFLQLNRTHAFLEDSSQLLIFQTFLHKNKPLTIHMREKWPDFLII